MPENTTKTPSKKTTKKRTQNAYFWGVWAKAKKLLKQGHFSDAEIEEERQEILRLSGAKKDAKGRYSMTTLSPAKMNTALDIIEVNILGLKNKKRGSKNLIWSIEQIQKNTPQLTDEYLNKISSDTYQVPNWRDLTKPQLTKFRFTATNRAKTFK